MARRTFRTRRTSTPRGTVGGHHRQRRPPGAWSRFVAAVFALAAVGIGVPVLLVLAAGAGLDAPHPFPALGSPEEITSYFRRDLTATEIAPIALRVLLVAAWVLWLGLLLSVLAAISEARGGALRSWLPRFAVFAGLGRWIAVGLTAVTTLAPSAVSSASLTSPRPFTVSSLTPDVAVAVEAPVAPGHARVQRGESIETFAQRTLGDAGRWTELWELNRDHVVGPDGEVWSAAWRLAPGWDLRLPIDAVPFTRAAAFPEEGVEVPAAPLPTPSAWAQRDNLSVVDEYEVVPGDSYWAIAERFLPGDAAERDVWDFTQALMAVNGPRLGYAHPAMIQPGDIVEIVALRSVVPVDPAAVPAIDPAVGDAIASSGAGDTHVVVAGDSYWEIAEASLGDAATEQDVLRRTNQLLDLNAPMLGYDDRRLIHPGDVVHLSDPATTATPDSPPIAVTDAAVVSAGALPPPAPPSTTTTPAASTAPTTTSTLPAPSPPAPPAADADADRGSPSSPIGVGQAALIATGIVALLVARRRARLRAAEPPARLPLPSPEMADTERRLRRLDAGGRLLRIDIVLRAAAARLADGGPRVVAVRSVSDGTIELHLSEAARLEAPWVGDDRTWVMPGRVAVDELAPDARAVGAPCVALTQLGVDEDGADVLVDLEALGLLAVDAPADVADPIVRALAAGLASSELAGAAHLVGVGVDEAAFLGHHRAQVVATVDEAFELAATLLGGTAASTRSTFTLRARHTSGETWEPAVVIIASAHAAELTASLLTSVTSRGGLAVVIGAPAAGAPWVLRPQGTVWKLEPLGLRVRPVGLDRDELDDLVAAIDGTVPEAAADVEVEFDVEAPVDADADAEVELDGGFDVEHSAATSAAPTAPILVASAVVAPGPERAVTSNGDAASIEVAGAAAPDGDGHLVVVDVVPTRLDTVVVPMAPGNGPANGHHVASAGGGNGHRPPSTGGHAERPAGQPAVEPPWSLMVRLLGPVQVVDRHQRAVGFERSKSLELIAWMATHRQGSSRSAARTALWDADVRDNTFANTVSDARRTLARHLPPPDGEDWVLRTMTEQLSLHDDVIADVDVVRARLVSARRSSAADALAVLRPAVDLVDELPFARSGYLWPDTEGTTSELVLLATNVTATFAELALAAGDVEGVFWSTGRGLRVLGGQEALIALRMRAHAEAGDLSGVRLEWESYERVLDADTWGDGEPAPKLVALRKQLLSR